MRDWLLILMPFGVIVYFLLYPREFTRLVSWVSGLMH